MTAYTERQKNNRKKKVINWLNETFGQLGMEPIQELPLGAVQESNHCVLAVALNDGLDEWKPESFNNKTFPYRVGTLKGSHYPGWSINSDAIQSPWNLALFEIPVHVQEFVEDFVYERYPELVDSDFDSTEYVWNEETNSWEYRTFEGHCDCGECNNDLIEKGD